MRYILLLALLLLSSKANESSYNKGEMLFFAKACNGCHGANAEGSSTTPKLANKKREYLIQRLQYFKKGKVNTMKQEMMVQFIINFTQEEIEDIATFLSKHKSSHTEDISEDLFGGYGS